MSLDRFDRLFELYSDGALGPEERTEFLGLLETAQGRARFAEASSYEAALAEELRVAAASQKTPSSRTLAKMGSRRSGAPREPEPDESRTLARIAALAAAAAILILTAVFAMSTNSRPPTPLVNHPIPLPTAPDLRTSEAPREGPPVPASPVAPRALSDPLVAPRPQAPRAQPAPPARDEAPAATLLPPSPRDSAAKPDENRPRESTTFVATLEQVSGDARLGDRPAEVGKGIASGLSLSTGRDGYLAARYPDGSKLELAGETVLLRIQDGPAGKTAFLESGMIFVEAAKQPAGKPMVVTTAHAESTVIGTQFVLAASASSTRLDVREGRVKFTRLPQAVSSIFVTAGHYAVAGGPSELVSKAGIPLWKAPAPGLQLWLKADAGTKTSGTAVAAWLDQSAAGNSAVQDKPASQPLLVANALGGRPALRFDGIDDFFQLPDGFSDFRLGLTVFVVVRPAAGAAWSRFIDLDIGPTCDNIVFGRKDSPDKLGFWVYANSLSKGKVEAPGAVVPDQVQILSARLDPGGRVTLYKNATVLATGETTVPKNTSRKPNGIAKNNSGGSEPGFKGDLFEILLYNRSLTEAERLYVESYLNAKYFDPATPPPALRISDR